MYGDVWRKEKLVNCPNLELDNIVYAKEGDVQRDILLVSISGQSYVCQGNIVYNAMVLLNTIIGLIAIVYLIVMVCLIIFLTPLLFLKNAVYMRQYNCQIIL